MIDVESSNSNNEEAGDITSYKGKTEVIGQDNNGLEITGIITEDANTCERDQPPANPQRSTECSASPSIDSKGADGDNDDNTKDENEITSLSFDPVAGLLSKQTETSDVQKKKSKDRLVATIHIDQRKDTAQFKYSLSESLNSKRKKLVEKRSIQIFVRGLHRHLSPIPTLKT